jgi:hypothetical protein
MTYDGMATVSDASVRRADTPEEAALLGWADTPGANARAL